MNCPMCLAPMAVKRVGEADFYLCRDCRGLWVQAGELAKMAQSIHSDDLPRRPVESAGDISGDVTLICPQCRQTMSKHPYSYDSGIMIDRCAGCGAIWLNVEKIMLVKQYLKESVPQPGEGVGLLGKPAGAGFFESDMTRRAAGFVVEGLAELLLELLD